MTVCRWSCHPFSPWYSRKFMVVYIYMCRLPSGNFENISIIEQHRLPIYFDDLPKFWRNLHKRQPTPPMVITPFRMLSSCNSATADVEIIVPYSHCLNLRYLRSKEHHYKVVPQFVSVQLVQIAPISLGFMVDISVFTMAYGLSTNFELGGAPPCG